MSRFFFCFLFFSLSLPRIQKRFGDWSNCNLSFLSFRLLLLLLYYNCVNGERILLTGKSFFFPTSQASICQGRLFSSGAKRNRRSSLSMCARYSNLAMIIYIYMICYAKISIIIVSIFQIPTKNRKVKINPPSSATSNWPPSELFFDLHPVLPKITTQR